LKNSDESRRAVRCLIFDLDGTLVKLPVDYSRLKRRLEELLDVDGGLISILSAVEGATAKRPEVLKRAFEIIDEEELDALIGMSEISGAKEAVAKLRMQGYRVALVTLQGEKVADRILEKTSLRDLFETVVTREDSMDRAGQLKVALKRLELKPEDAVMVGDRVNDVEAAKKVGCRVILVRSVWLPHPDAEVTVTSVKDIEGLLQDLG